MAESRISYQSPAGDLVIVAEGGALVRLEWSNKKFFSPDSLLRDTAKQLDEYFSGWRKDFDLPFSLGGTEFCCRVWREMLLVDYGCTATYGELARRLGSAPRAVGLACGKNPLPIIVPCHRIVGASGSLTGYSGGDGVATKEWLLKLEGGGKL